MFCPKNLTLLCHPNSFVALTAMLSVAQITSLPNVIQYINPTSLFCVVLTRLQYITPAGLLYVVLTSLPHVVLTDLLCVVLTGFPHVVLTGLLSVVLTGFHPCLPKVCLNIKQYLLFSVRVRFIIINIFI